MMGDVDFSDLIRIYKIRSKIRQPKPVERNKNFQEFTDVYKEVFTSSLPDASRLKVTYGGTRCRYIERFPKRPLHDVKKIRMEMPVLGAERAIVTPPALPVVKKPKKKVETKDKSFLTESQITKWVGKKDTVKPVQVQTKCPSLTDTQLLLEKARQQIEESDSDYKAVRSIIDQIRPPDKVVRKSRIPTFKAKRKPDRHAECISKKYVTTLNTMQQKLQKLEEKYFGKPRVIYKNVRDICTTFSNIDLLYKADSSTAAMNINETLSGIKQELDDMANGVSVKEEKKTKPKTVTFKAPEVEFNTVGDTYDEERNITPMNFSFKKPVSLDDDDEDVNEQEVNYVKVIDRSESFFRKYQNLTRDVEEFYDEIKQFEDKDNRDGELEDEEEVKSEEPDSRSVTEGSDSETHDSEVDKFYNRDSPAYFSKEMKDVISSSLYLSKEFGNKQPTVKVFTGSDRYVRNKSLGISSNTSTSIDPSIMNLIDNLSLSLKDSIYYKTE